MPGAGKLSPVQPPTAEQQEDAPDDQPKFSFRPERCFLHRLASAAFLQVQSSAEHRTSVLRTNRNQRVLFSLKSSLQTETESPPHTAAAGLLAQGNTATQLFQAKLAQLLETPPVCS